MNKIKVLQQLIKKELINNGVEFCLSKNGQCNQKIIKAHSIQNKNVLSLISDSTNHVHSMSHDHEAIFEKMSVKKASTFKGFCGYHDNRIFKYIDDDIYSNLDKDKASLLYAIRAVAKELYAKKNLVAKFEQLFSKYDNGQLDYITKKFPILSFHDVHYFLGLNGYYRSLVDGNRMSILELEKTFKLLMDANSENKSSVIKNIVIKVNGVKNVVASTCFAPEYNSKGEAVNILDQLDKSLKSIFLTVIPDEKYSYIIISYLRKDAKFLLSFTNDINKMSLQEKKFYIERLLITHCENMFFSESFIQKLTEKQKIDLNKSFVGTILEQNLVNHYMVGSNNLYNFF